MPWLNNWQSFLPYLVQYGVPGADNDKPLIRSLIRAEMRLISLGLPMPPLSSLLLSESWKQIREEVEAIANRHFDVVWIENTLAWPYAANLIKLLKNQNPFIICSSQNVEHFVLLRQAINSRDRLSRQFLNNQVRLMKRMEHAAWRKSSLIIQCSDNDAAVTKKTVPQKPVIVIPNGVDQNYFCPNPEIRRDLRPLLVFTAGFGYAPNQEGLTWFLSNVYPKIRRSIKEVRFLFAGSNAKDFATLFGQLPEGVEFLSDPSDMRPVFQRGHVYVAPLLSGGGSRLKILEAISMQIPVVSTSLGAEGIPYDHGRHLLLADSSDEFAECVITLLSDEKLRIRLTNDALDFINNRFTWAKLCDDAESLILRSIA
jgi:glycosyltransferase involved in cell wall biosynthesis